MTRPIYTPAVVAHHEAGHAVVAHLRGGPGRIEVESVVIYDQPVLEGDNDGHWGRTTYGYIAPWLEFEEVQATMAGPIAQSLFEGDDDSDDAPPRLWAALVPELGQYLDRDDFDQVYQSTLEMVLEEWETISAVAADLVMHGRLNGDELATIIDGGGAE